MTAVNAADSGIASVNQPSRRARPTLITLPASFIAVMTAEMVEDMTGVIIIILLVFSLGLGARIGGVHLLFWKLLVLVLACVVVVGVIHDPLPDRFCIVRESGPRRTLARKAARARWKSPRKWG